MIYFPTSKSGSQESSFREPGDHSFLSRLLCFALLRYVYALHRLDANDWKHLRLEVLLTTWNYQNSHFIESATPRQLYTSRGIVLCTVVCMANHRSYQSNFAEWTVTCPALSWQAWRLNVTFFKDPSQTETHKVKEKQSQWTRSVIFIWVGINIVAELPHILDRSRPEPPLSRLKWTFLYDTVYIRNTNFITPRFIASLVHMSNMRLVPEPKGCHRY